VTILLVKMDDRYEESSTDYGTKTYRFPESSVLTTKLNGNASP